MYWLVQGKTTFMKPEQLIADDTFLAWYFQTDESSVRKWNRLISEDISLKASADEAVLLLNLIHQKEDRQVSHQQIERSRQVLMNRVNEWELNRQTKPVFRITYRHALQLAACLVLIGFGVFWFWQSNRQQERYSAKGTLTAITLADGTVVSLIKVPK